jgi:hypothetical protein
MNKNLILLQIFEMSLFWAAIHSNNFQNYANSPGRKLFYLNNFVTNMVVNLGTIY